MQDPSKYSQGQADVDANVLADCLSVKDKEEIRDAAQRSGLNHLDRNTAQLS